MKTILLIAAITTLLTTSGCLVSEGHRHGHGEYREHNQAYVPAPAIVVPVRVHID